MLDAAKARLQDALKEEEVARNEIAGLDAQGPSSLIAPKILGQSSDENSQHAMTDGEATDLTLRRRDERFGGSPRPL